MKTESLTTTQRPSWRLILLLNQICNQNGEYTDNNDVQDEYIRKTMTNTTQTVTHTQIVLTNTTISGHERYRNKNRSQVYCRASKNTHQPTSYEEPRLPKRTGFEVGDHKLLTTDKADRSQSMYRPIDEGLHMTSFHASLHG